MKRKRRYKSCPNCKEKTDGAFCDKHWKLLIDKLKEEDKIMEYNCEILYHTYLEKNHTVLGHTSF